MFCWQKKTQQPLLGKLKSVSGSTNNEWNWIFLYIIIDFNFFPFILIIIFLVFHYFLSIYIFFDNILLFLLCSYNFEFTKFFCRDLLWPLFLTDHISWTNIFLFLEGNALRCPEKDLSLVWMELRFGLKEEKKLFNNYN